MAAGAPPSLHVVLFPFMAKGHTIPIIQLARRLLRRNAAVTLFTTTDNRPFISAALSGTTTSIITLPFPNNIPGVPSGVESTDKLPSMSLFHPFVSSTKLMKPHFDQALRSLQPPATFMVTDGFFGWTLDSANEFNIPRLVYYGMSNFAITMSGVISQNPNLFHGKSDHELVPVPGLPGITATKIEFQKVFTSHDQDDHAKWVTEQILATTKSYGLVTNSFAELESVFADFWNTNLGPKSWSVGPFCLGQDQNLVPSSQNKKPWWMVWLDEKLKLGKPVLYVAFGSQADISLDQLEEIKLGLKRSEVDFLWVVRRAGEGFGLDDGLEERGIVVEEWVDQREILEHESVKGFLSHCGWNSVLESICAAVPILAWPLAAEQPLNAKFVAEVVKIGVRVETCDGSVKSEELEKKVRELMEGEKGKAARKKVAEIGGAAVKAVAEGGSSWRGLNELIDELQSRV